jgi:hypothetical protein
MWNLHSGIMQKKVGTLNKIKKKLLVNIFLLKLRENLVQARPRVVVTSISGICQVEFSRNRGYC